VETVSITENALIIRVYLDEASITPNISQMKISAEQTTNVLTGSTGQRKTSIVDEYLLIPLQESCMTSEGQEILIQLHKGEDDDETYTNRIFIEGIDAKLEVNYDGIDQIKSFTIDVDYNQYINN